MKLHYILLVLICCLIVGGCSSKDKVTMEQYNKIQLGMTTTEIDQIIKSPGKEMSSSYTPGISGTPSISLPGGGSIPGIPDTPATYVVTIGWQNKDGSNAMITFQGNTKSGARVINKAQAGL